MGPLHPIAYTKRVSLHRIFAFGLALCLDGVGKDLASRESGIECSGSTVKLLSMPTKALLLVSFRSNSGGDVGQQKLSREMRDKDEWFQVSQACSMVEYFAMPLSSSFSCFQLSRVCHNTW